MQKIQKIKNKKQKKKQKIQTIQKKSKKSNKNPKYPKHPKNPKNAKLCIPCLDPDMVSIVLDFLDFLDYLKHWMLSLSYILDSSLCLLACSNSAQLNQKKVTTRLLQWCPCQPITSTWTLPCQPLRAFSSGIFLHMLRWANASRSFVDN